MKYYRLWRMLWTIVFIMAVAILPDRSDFWGRLPMGMLMFIALNELFLPRPKS